MIEVCPVCYKFLQTIYDKKKMKEIKLINQPAMQEHVSQEISRLEWFLLLQQEEKMKKDKKKKL